MKRAITIMFSLCAINCYAQDYPRKNIDASRLADELFGFQDQDLNYGELYENTLQLLSNPININKVTSEELRFLNILTEKQIQDLIQFRNENGNFLSVYELQSVPGFDLSTIYKIIPFVYVPDPAIEMNASIFRRALEEDNNYLITRYERIAETSKGYTREVSPEKRFKGSPDKMYMRFRTSRPGDFSFGFTAEKDAGEQTVWNTSSNQYLFDYISWHAQVQNKGRIKNIIIGDYQAQFAQGLMFGGAFGMGKGAETITTTRRCNIGFSPYTSANEFGAQHGVAATYELSKDFYLSAFLSDTKRDAHITAGESDTGISSFQYTGLHRNETELQYRKAVKEENSGIILHYNHGNLDAGLMYNYLHYNKPVNAKQFIYNQFSFSGRENKNAGFYFNYNYQNFLFFSEVAQSLSGGIGGVAGVITSLTSNLDISFLYRKYDRNFHSTYTNAFSESTTPQNESGMYWGWRYALYRKLSFAGYMDIFRFPWLRFRSYEPTNGSEWLTRLTYQPSRTVSMFVQAREEQKARNISNDPTLYRVATGRKRNLWINFNYQITARLQMKTRAQFSDYCINNKTTKGMALIHDISYSFRRFQITGRYALFDTDDFDNRQYVYEQDVWLAYSLPSYYGTGIRNFILLEYNVNKKLTLWLRYARTRYTTGDTISTQEDEIKGNTKDDIKIQMRIKL
jgi:hypothetical protein